MSKHDTLRIRQNLHWISRALIVQPSVGTWGLVRTLTDEGCDPSFANKLLLLLDPEHPGT